MRKSEGRDAVAVTRDDTIAFTSHCGSQATGIPGFPSKNFGVPTIFGGTQAGALTMVAIVSTSEAAPCATQWDTRYQTLFGSRENRERTYMYSR
ncbi:hypothetical protein G5I_10878 [Acromyrmex echinatior]|uniref:Uncharacterized protein n=1 Tax=Acromyrmex echinatior TaxID=103372 RepID=F4WY33_ACREC|nr:hypothetical protein G5I_10878 [Acromyrmex echinatior]